MPSDSALYQARARLGWAPLRRLRRQVLRPLADRLPDPSAFYRGMRLLAIDGTTFTVADTPDNERTFGRAGNQHGRSGYPLMRLVALCEVGTHALLRWVARSYGVGEQALAARLWRHVPAGTLSPGDRNFHCFGLWQAARAGCRDVLARLQAGPRFVVDQALPDGSFLSWVYPRRGKSSKARAARVRVITSSRTDEAGEAHVSRLLTSLPDAAAHPAAALVELYHRRREQEGVFREIKSALQGRATQVRAHDPLRALQELAGRLLGHFVLRGVTLQVEISFGGALRVLRTCLGAPAGAGAKGERWWKKLKEAVGRQTVQKRRGRRCPRKKKVARQAWPTKKPRDGELPIPAFAILPPPP